MLSLVTECELRLKSKIADSKKQMYMAQGLNFIKYHDLLMAGFKL